MASNPETSESQKPEVQKGEKGIVGLKNLGNTCYANAAIQALRNVSELTYLCLMEDSTLIKRHENHSGILFDSYKDLIKTMWSVHRPAYVSADAFWRDVLLAARKSGYDYFGTRQQQDSHEFLMFLLDQLLEGTKHPVNFVIQRPPPTNSREKRVQAALESWKMNFEKQYTPIVDIMFGLLEYETECMSCNSKTYRYETFNTLKVSMPSSIGTEKPPTLNEMIREDWKDEEIQDFDCETCRPKRTTVKRRVKIWRMPRCFILLLKRFLPDGRKIHTPWLLEDGPLLMTEHFSEATTEKSKAFKYGLQSIVDHHGSARGGHYTAQALSPLDGKWYFYDDESVGNLEKPMIGPSNYILIFRAAD